MNVVTWFDGGRAGGAVAAADVEELPGRGADQVGEHRTVALVHLARLGHLGVALVHVHGGGRVESDALHHPDVVGMRVGEDHRVDVADAAPARAQVLVELGPEAGQAAVDQRQVVAFLEQVAVHQGVAEPVHAGCHLSGCVLHGCAAWQGSNPAGVIGSGRTAVQSVL